MRQETEPDVRKEFEQARVEGRQPLCPYCKAPLEIGQYYSVYVQWTWNHKKKGYQQDGPNWDDDTPFCGNCGAKDWDFTNNDLAV